MTKEKFFETKSMKPMQIMYRKKPSNGLFPIKINQRDGNFADTHITFGALGDSFYEYLLKIWLQGGRKETWLRYDTYRSSYKDSHETLHTYIHAYISTYIHNISLLPAVINVVNVLDIEYLIYDMVIVV